MHAHSYNHNVVLDKMNCNGIERERERERERALSIICCILLCYSSCPVYYYYYGREEDPTKSNKYMANSSFLKKFKKKFIKKISPNFVVFKI